MGGKKSSEHREDVHDPPPGCAEATALALARDCRSCAHGRSSASLLALRMRPWRRGTAAARNVEEGGLRDRQLRHPLHQRDEVDDRREGLVRKVRIDPPWSCTCAKVAGEVIHHLASVRGAVRISDPISSMFGFERGTVRGLHGWQGWVFDSHRSSPSFARMRLESLWRAAWSEAGRVLPTCRDEGGSRKGCVRRA